MTEIEAVRVDPVETAAAQILWEEKQLRRDVTYPVLVERTGMTRSTIGRVLNGSTPLTISYLRLIARAMDLEPGDVLARAMERVDS